MFIDVLSMSTTLGTRVKCRRILDVSEESRDVTSHDSPFENPLGQRASGHISRSGIGDFSCVAESTWRLCETVGVASPEKALPLDHSANICRGLKSLSHP